MTDQSRDSLQSRKAWHRRPGETDKGYAALTVYVSLGPARSLDEAFKRHTGKGFKKLPKARKCVPGNWIRRSVEWDWVQRAQAWDASQGEKILKTAENAKLTAVTCTVQGMANVAQDYMESTDRTVELEEVRPQLKRLMAACGKGGANTAARENLKALIGEKHQIHNTSEVITVEITAADFD